jgi:hypothetical protein
MEIATAFAAYQGHEAVFANSPGARDSFDPTKPVKYDPSSPRTGPLGWHDDVMGMKTPNVDILGACVSSLTYLDETFADNGAYCAAIGSHHLARVSADRKPVFANAELVLSSCELRPIPVQPGTAILSRAHLWHGVVPPRQRRRLVLQGFSTKAHYDLQIGHTQLSAASLALIPPDRHRYLTSYGAAR